MYSIEIWRGGEKLAEARGENEAALLYRGAYEAGDEIRFSSDSQHAVVQVDQQVKPARVYLPSGAFVYRPPMAGDGLAVYPPMAFAGNMHLMSIKPDESSEYAIWRKTRRISAERLKHTLTRRQTSKRATRAALRRAT